jgi:hypothetical protein
MKRASTNPPLCTISLDSPKFVPRDCLRQSPEKSECLTSSPCSWVLRVRCGELLAWEGGISYDWKPPHPTINIPFHGGLLWLHSLDDGLSSPTPHGQQPGRGTGCWKWLAHVFQKNFAQTFSFAMCLWNCAFLSHLPLPIFSSTSTPSISNPLLPCDDPSGWDPLGDATRCFPLGSPRGIGRFKCVGSFSRLLGS